MAIEIRGINNRLAVPSLIADESLFRLMDNLVLPRLSNQTYEKYFENKIGDRITVKRPYMAKVNSGRILAESDIASMIDQTVDIMVDQRHNFAIRYNDQEKTLDLVQFGERYLRTGIEELAYQYDIAGANELGLSISYSEGTPGTGLSTSAAQKIGAHARHVAIPLNSMNYGLIDPMDFANISDDVKAVQLPEMVSTAIRERYNGKLGNWHLFESVHIPYLDVASHTGSTPLVNMVGGYEGKDLPTDGWANSTQVLNKGQLFTIAGVYEVQPRGNRRTTGRLFTFCAADDVTSSATGTATIPLVSTLNAGTLTDLDSQGNSVSLSAFQNVSAAAADNAAITIVGTLGSTYRQGVFYEKSLLEYINVELESFESAVLQGQSTEEQTGVSVSLVGWFDGLTRRETQRVDILFGTKAIYPELGIRFISDAV